MGVKCMKIFLFFIAVIGFILKIKENIEKNEKAEKREAYYPNGKLLLNFIMKMEI